MNVSAVPVLGCDNISTGSTSVGRSAAIVSNMSVEILVPQTVIALVYGENGSKLTRLRQIPGAKVVVHEPRSGTSDHIVVISERAESLARAVSGEALPIEQLDAYCPENGMILANCSAIGMELDVHLTPVSKENLRSYDLVFDAVYTPRNTRLLQEAVEVGVTVVSGVEMFIRQALGQFRLFTYGLERMFMIFIKLC
ncbi:hypothetical protein Lser_V15G28199 [Lactuca serriola]